MTAETTTVSVPRPKYRDYFPTIVTIIGGILLVLWLILGRGSQQILAWDPVLLWFVLLALLTVALLVIGQVGNGQWLGVLISPQFKMSLSRLQIVLWTLLVLSAYITIAIHRLSGNLATMDEATLAACKTKLGKATFTPEECGGGAINITFPSELLVAMGISAASFAGTSIIQSNKKGKEVNLDAKGDRIAAEQEKVKKAMDDLEAAETALQKARLNKEQTAAAAVAGGGEADTLKAYAEKAYNKAAMERELASAAVENAKKDLEQTEKDKENAETEAEGLLHKNAKPSDARFKNIFMGDEIGNFQLVDMSKVQMFFLTVVVVVIYGVAVAASLHNAAVMKNPIAYNFPSFSDTLNSLMAISHGTYLSVKSVDHTKSNP